MPHTLPPVRQRDTEEDWRRLILLDTTSKDEILECLRHALRRALAELPPERSVHPFLRLMQVRMNASSLRKLLELRRYPQIEQFPELYSVLYDHDAGRLYQDQRILARLAVLKRLPTMKGLAPVKGR